MRFKFVSRFIVVLGGVVSRQALYGNDGVHWTKFQDANERAFAVDVPANWTVKGGLFRLGYSDARPMIDLTSPDGKINVRLGDVAIPAYFVPDRLHSREGETYGLGAQAHLTVARYRSAQEYAALYAKSRFASVCASFNPQSAGEAEPMRDYAPEDVAARQSSASQVAYRCDGAQGSRVVYVYSRTSLYQGLWTVRTLGSLIAPPEQVALAHSVLLRASQSFQLSPQWMDHQKQMDQEALTYQRERQQRMRALSQQVAQFEVEMQAMRNQVNAFERQQAGQADQVRSFGNTLTGLTPTTDPLGNPRDVWTGPKNGYWTNGTGQVINSDLFARSGLAAHADALSFFD
jgi:hypothetical protein